MTDDNKSCPLNSSNGLAILIVIGIVAIGLLAVGLKDNNITIESSATDNTISVNASIEMEIDPDIAIISLGVSHSMATALEAQDAVNIAMNDIVDALEDLGLTEDDIETSSITLSEQWSWRDDEYETTGWRASQTLTITTTDISMAGEIIDVSVENGANDINGVTFSLSDESEKAYRILALEQVGELAKEKAEAICEGLGVNLGGIKSVSESGVYYVSYDAEEYDLKNDASSVTPTVVISGSVSVTASIYVVYYID